MKGKFVLSYIDHAAPLTIDIIKADLTLRELQASPLPDEILVWEHQWDYLKKKNRGKGAWVRQMYKLDDVEWDHESLSVRATARKVECGGQVLGIPVEVLPGD